MCQEHTPFNRFNLYNGTAMSRYNRKYEIDFESSPAHQIVVAYQVFIYLLSYLSRPMLFGENYLALYENLKKIHSNTRMCYESN